MVIAVRDDIEYSVVEIGSDQLIVAKDRVEHVLSHLPQGTAFATIVESISGSQLATNNAACFNLFTATESPILHADFVTASTGTGLVHMAPGHGMDDYQVCQQNNIGPAFAPVDDEGRYTAEAFPSHVDGKKFRGLPVQTSGVKAVLEVLTEPSKYLPSGSHETSASLLLAAHRFTHKNPIDWRTKQPVIVRATAQWFADVSAIKDRALAALENVHFIPASGKVRLRSFVEGRSQWCISRQRAWGVPIPALYSVQTGEVCISPESVDHIISTVQQKGTDAWFSDPRDDPSWLHSSLEPGKWIRGKDTMDVWFDSGTTWTSLEKRGEGVHLSDVYVEGTDQHRGWFQSSLLTAIATQQPDAKPMAPFATLATHGFTLDGEGKKMSKSLGNVIAPEEIILGKLIPASTKAKNKNKGKSPPAQSKPQNTLGPDVLRLWVASSDYTKDVSISQPVLQSVQQALQKYRVTFKFLLGVLHDYPAPYPQTSLLRNLDFADQVVLHQLSKCSAAVFSAYGEYKFYAGINEINKFVNNELSAFYFEIVKDTLYAGSSARRRHTQTVLLYILQELKKMLGPATPHLVEEVWEWLPEAMKRSQSRPDDQNAASMDMELHPLRQVWDRPFDAASTGLGNGDSMDGPIQVFRMISSAVKIAQEEARAARHLGSGLACKVVICLHKEVSVAHEDLAWLQTADLASLLVVSQVELQPWDYSLSRTSAWQYEQSFSRGTSAESSEHLAQGRVIVLPPEGEKCVRCWKYTADDQALPCASCREAIAETLG